MAVPEVLSLAGDVLRRSSRSPSEIFEDLAKALTDQHCISRNFTDARVEAVVMMDGVVLHVSVKLFKDEDSTLLVYRDLLGQDIIRFHKLIRLLQSVLDQEKDQLGDLESEYTDLEDEDERMADTEVDELRSLQATPTSAEVTAQKHAAAFDLWIKEACSSKKSAIEAAQILAKRAPDQPEAVAEALCNFKALKMEIPLVGSSVTSPAVPPLLAATKRVSGRSADEERRFEVLRVLQNLQEMPWSWDSKDIPVQMPEPEAGRLTGGYKA